MAATRLTTLKQQCTSTYEVFAAASTRTQQLLAEVELPISKELRGSLLNQLQVEHQAQERYLAARQELFLFVQEQFRRP